MTRWGMWMALAMCVGGCDPSAGPPNRSSPEFERLHVFTSRRVVLDRTASAIAWYDSSTGEVVRLHGESTELLAELPTGRDAVRVFPDDSIFLRDSRYLHLHSPGVDLETEPFSGTANGRGVGDLWLLTRSAPVLRRCHRGDDASCEDIPAPDADVFCVTPEGAVYFASDEAISRHDVVTTEVGSLLEPLEELRCTEDGVLGLAEHSVVWTVGEALQTFEVPAPASVAAADRRGEEAFVLTNENGLLAPPEPRSGYVGCDTILSIPCEDLVPASERWSQYVLYQVGESASELGHRSCSAPDCRDSIRGLAVDDEQVFLLGSPSWRVLLEVRP